MSWAGTAAGSAKPPKKEDLSYLLIHFSVRLTEENVIVAVQGATKMSPFGILPHPRGAIVAFRSVGDRTKAANILKGEVRIGHVKAPVTHYPELKTPAAERGKRWRISGVPLHLDHVVIKEALGEHLKISEIKLETVRNHPATRTQYVTFWSPDKKDPPKKIEVEGANLRIFDPEKSPPKEAPKEAEDGQVAVEPAEGGQEATSSAPKRTPPRRSKRLASALSPSPPRDHKAPRTDAPRIEHVKLTIPDAKLASSFPELEKIGLEPEILDGKLLVVIQSRADFIPPVPRIEQICSSVLPDSRPLRLVTVHSDKASRHYALVCQQAQLPVDLRDLQQDTTTKKGNGRQFEFIRVKFDDFFPDYVYE